jgi:hypothetical protein
MRLFVGYNGEAQRLLTFVRPDRGGMVNPVIAVDERTASAELEGSAP